MTIANPGDENNRESATSDDGAFRFDELQIDEFEQRWNYELDMRFTKRQLHKLYAVIGAVR